MSCTSVSCIFTQRTFLHPKKPVIEHVLNSTKHNNFIIATMVISLSKIFIILANNLVFTFQSEDLFASQETPDIEDVLSPNSQNKKAPGPMVTSSKRKRPIDQPDAHRDLNKSWRDAIGNPPKIGNSKVSFVYSAGG